jgi:hypothetical protein
MNLATNLRKHRRTPIVLALAAVFALAACDQNTGQTALNDEQLAGIRSQLEVVEQRLDEVYGLLVNAQNDVEGEAAVVIDEAQAGIDDSMGTLANVLAELPPAPAPVADPVPGADPAMPAPGATDPATPAPGATDPATPAPNDPGF